MFVVFLADLQFLFDFTIEILCGLSMFFYKYNKSLGRFLFSVCVYFRMNFIDHALKLDFSHFLLCYCVAEC